MDHPADDARVYSKEIRALREVYGEVTLAAPPAFDPAWIGASGAGLTWKELPWYRSPVRLWRNWMAANRVVRSLPGPRIVHVHEPESAVAAWLFRWCDRRSLIFDAHEDYPALRSHHGRGVRRLVIRGFTGLLDRVAARVAGHVITVNEELRGRYERLGARTSVVSNACEDIPDDRLPPARDPGRVVYVGGLSEPRGIPCLIDAVESLLADGVDARLDLAGRVLDEAAGARIASATRAHPDRIRYHGRISRDEVFALLGECSIGVVPFERVSFFEGRPVKLLEYATAGNALVVTDQGPKAAFVREHGCGAVVPPGDRAALAAAIRERIEDGGVRARAEGGRARFAARALNWEHVDRPVLLSVYEEVVRASA